MVQKLTELQIKNAKPGMHADGGNNLYLSVNKQGAKSWIFRFKLKDKRRDVRSLKADLARRFGAAAALATLEVFEQEQTLPHLLPKITRLTEHLNRLAQHPQVGDVRQRGLIAGIELVRDRATRDPFILTGDMNSPESSTTIRLYKGPQDLAGPAAASLDTPPLRDTFRVVRPDETGVSTRHQFTGSRNGEKVDYILVPPAFEVVSAEILRDQINGKYPSDHFPVAAALRLPLK